MDILDGALTAPPTDACRRLHTAAALPVALVSSAATLMLLLILGRGALYPFWAAQASHADLARSWGGPTPVGATAVHVLGAMGVGLVGLVLLRALRAAHAR